MAYSSVLLFSDWHYGEVVNLPYNIYNPDVCRKRVAAVTRNFLSWQSGFLRPRTVYVLLLGDLISGEIHHEFCLTQYESPLEQAISVANIITSCVKQIAKKYKTSVFCLTTDNHSRMHEKVIYKKRSSYNYNTVLAETLQKNLPKQVSLQISREIIDFIKIEGKTYLVTHGDIIRSLNTLDKLQTGAYKRATELKTPNPDYFLMGHFHEPTFYKNTIINGCLTGVTEYAVAKNHSGIPCQVAFHATDKGIKNFNILDADTNVLDQV